MQAGYPAAIIMLASCSPIQAHAAASTYECANGKSFSVTQTSDGARVEFANRTYELTRRSSSMGTRYSSPEASLIVDGDLAVFATQRIFDLRLCGLVDS